MSVVRPTANKSFHLTNALGTRLASAKRPPNTFEGEANVRNICCVGCSVRQILNIFAVFFVVLFLGSCGDDSTTEPGEHVWSVKYTAINESNSDIIVGLSGPATSGATSAEYSVPAGTTIELLSYDALLASFPEVENDIWCVSVLLELDRTLVHQLCPVSNDQWELGESNGYKADFGLIIQDADLEPREDICPRLAGVVFESETGNAIVGATVDYLGNSSFDLPTNSSGRYLFYLPEVPIHGVITISKEGYQTVEHILPGGVVGNSFGLYRLDFGLLRTGG